MQPSLHDKRILVVDDNATNRRILVSHLDTWGMRARATESPAEALGWISPGNGVLLYGHFPPAPITLRPWFRDRQLQAMVNPADAGTSRRRAIR